MNNNNKIPVIAVPIAEAADRSGYYALGLLIAYAKQYQEGKLLASFDFKPIRAFAEQDLDDFLAEQDFSTPAIYLFSTFVWNEDSSLRAAVEIRRRSPESLIVFGGANIPRRPHDAEQYLQTHEVIDMLGIGEGEEIVAELLAQLATQPETLRHADLHAINGLAYRQRTSASDQLPAASDHIVITTPRGMIRDINTIPSPYLSGVYAEGSLYGINEAYTETTRGCPFGCTFCDWGGQTLSKVRKFDIERVIKELEWFHHMGIRNIRFTDANFGMLQRDVELTNWLVDVKQRTNWPDTFVVSTAKNSADRVAEICSKLYRVGLTGEKLAIALQTMDDATLMNIDRFNIKTSDYEKVIAIFRHNGMQMYTELLMGLPGQTVDTFCQDLQKSFEWMILADVYPVRVMPNAPMGDPAYQQKFAMVVDDEGYSVASYSFTQDDLALMTWMRMVYFLFIHQNMTKYIFMYYQADKKVDAMRIVDRLIKRHAELQDKYPDLIWIIDFARTHIFPKNRDWLLLHWKHEEGLLIHQRLEAIFQQLFDFTDAEFSVSTSAVERQALIALQKATFMHYRRKLPEIITAPLDVVGYFQQMLTVVSLKELPDDFKPLSSFGTGEIHVPAQRVRLRMGFLQHDLRATEWALTIGGLEAF